MSHKNKGCGSGVKISSKPGMSLRTAALAACLGEWTEEQARKVLHRGFTPGLHNGKEFEVAGFVVRSSRLLELDRQKRAASEADEREHTFQLREHATGKIVMKRMMTFHEANRRNLFLRGRHYEWRLGCREAF